MNMKNHNNSTKALFIGLGLLSPQIILFVQVLLYPLFGVYVVDIPRGLGDIFEFMSTLGLIFILISVILFIRSGNKKAQQLNLVQQTEIIKTEANNSLQSTINRLTLILLGGLIFAWPAVMFMAFLPGGTRGLDLHSAIIIPTLLTVPFITLPSILFAQVWKKSNPIRGFLAIRVPFFYAVYCIFILFVVPILDEFV
jgi:hypothetical protein